jgi:hypothetical protein
LRDESNESRRASMPALEAVSPKRDRRPCAEKIGGSGVG